MTEEKKRKVLDLSSRTMTRPGGRIGSGFGTIITDGNEMRITGPIPIPTHMRRELMMSRFIEQHKQSGGGEVWSGDTFPGSGSHSRARMAEAVGSRANMELIENALSSWAGEVAFVHLDGPRDLVNMLRDKVGVMLKNNNLVEVRRISGPRAQFASSRFPSAQIESLRHMSGQHHRSIYLLAYGGGIHDIIGLSAPSSLRNDLLGYPGISPAELSPLNMLMDTAGVGWWAILQDVLFVTDPPKSMVTMNGAPNILDNPSGPAVTYQDGTEIYAISGIVMTKSAHYLYNNPDEINLELVFNESIVDSEEVRRLLIREKGGLESLLGGIDDPTEVEVFTLIEEDEYGKLYEFSSPNRSSPLGRFRVVVVENFTPEPDGSRRKYYLTVPESVTTPKEGVAWTYGFRDAESFNIDSSA